MGEPQLGLPSESVALQAAPDTLVKVIVFPELIPSPEEIGESVAVLSGAKGGFVVRPQHTDPGAAPASHGSSVPSTVTVEDAATAGTDTSNIQAKLKAPASQARERDPTRSKPCPALFDIRAG